jgi:pimeloyl-ACP methyl ester carboxylesterase
MMGTLINQDQEVSMGNWIESRIAGHPCDLFEPASTNELGLMVLTLDGHEPPRLRDQLRFTELFEHWRLPVVAPYGGRCWWVNKPCPDFDAQTTPERHLIEKVLPFISERWGAQAPRIGLLGIGMGGQGALRLAYKFPNRFPVTAAISPSIDYQLRYDDDETLQLMYSDQEAARQDTATLYIHPLNWPRHQFFCCDPADPEWWDGVDRLRMKLYSLGVPHECDLETSCNGRRAEYNNLMAERAIQFIVARLEQESRRAAP